MGVGNKRVTKSRVFRKGDFMMIPQNNLEGPVKFFAENRAAHATALLFFINVGRGITAPADCNKPQQRHFKL